MRWIFRRARVVCALFMNMAKIKIIVSMIVSLVAGFFIGRSGQEVVTKEVPASDQKQLENPVPRGRTPSGSDELNKAVQDDAQGILAESIKGVLTSGLRANDSENILAVWEVVRLMTQEDIEVALRGLDIRTDTSVNHLVRNLLYKAWAKKDGEAALEMILKEEAPGEKENYIHSALLTWMQKDHEAAYRWMTANDNQFGKASSMKVDVMLAYFTKTSQRDMAGTFEKLEGLDPVVYGQMITGLTGQMATNDQLRAKFFDKVREQGDPNLTSTTLTHLVSMMTLDKPEKVSQKLDELNLTLDQRTMANSQFVSGWSKKDPQSALEWAKQIKPDEMSAGDAIKIGFGVWAREDAEAAGKWLEQQSDEFKVDTVYRAAAEQLIHAGRFLVASEWMEKLKDEGTRLGAYAQLYSQWKVQSPDEAAAWIEVMDDETQAAVKKMIEPGRFRRNRVPQGARPN